MSYLLEALKKSERQRLATAPTLNSTVAVPMRRRSAAPTAWIAAGLAFAVLTIGLGWWLGARKAQPVTEAAPLPLEALVTQAAPPARAPVPPTPAPAPVQVAPLAVAPPPAPMVMALARPAPQPAPQLAPAPAPAPVRVREPKPRPVEPAARVPAAPIIAKAAPEPAPRLVAAPQLSAAPAVAKPVPTPAALPPPEPRPSEAPVRENPPPRENRVLAFNELPTAVRQALPALNLSGYVQGGDGSMMAAVNDHLLREGEEAAPGLTVDRILADGIIFRYRNYRFRR